MLKVRYCGKDNTVYNTDGLTVGNVYEVKDVTGIKKDRFLITNDNNEDKYYHRSIFKEASQDFEESPYQYLTNDTIKGLNKEDAEFSEFIEKLSEAISEVIYQSKNCDYSGYLFDIILQGICQHPDVTIDLFKGYAGIMPKSYRYFPVCVVDKSHLGRLDGYHYKITPKDPTVRIIHKMDYFLIKSHILLIIPDDNNTPPTI